MELYLAIPIALWAWALYSAYWRLYLSPISHIPGPKLAALTRLYEAYYDLWLGGQYTFKIIALHKIYGPIIRISPWEVHISDPDFYEVIYASSASGHRRDKYDWFTKSFGLDNSVFATPGHDLHRLRRSALAPYFSTASVKRLQPLLQERVNKLLERFEGFRDTGGELNTSWAYAAFTNDVVMTYCFARSGKRLEAPDFDPSYRDASFFGSTAGNFMKHAPWVNNLMQSLPNSIAELLHPAMATYVNQKREVLAHVQEITSKHSTNHLDLDHPTIFHSILDSKLPESEKRDIRLTDDAHVLTMAGTITTSWVLEVTTYHFLTNPSILRRLKAELTSAIPHPSDIGTISLTTLESLPYLNACMKEGLRLTYGVSCRLARSDPDNPIIFTAKDSGKTYTIPPNTPVGMTSVQLHHDESLFPDSWTFNPDRWLDGKNKAIDKYMVSFTAGSRQCMGINLAYAEMYLSLSGIWRVWGSKDVKVKDDVGWFELYETSKRDVEIEGDSFLPLVQKGSKGVRVMAHK